MSRKALILSLIIITYSWMKKNSFYTDLDNYLKDIETEFIKIPQSRIEILQSSCNSGKML